MRKPLPVDGYVHSGVSDTPSPLSMGGEAYKLAMLSELETPQRMEILRPATLR